MKMKRLLLLSVTVALLCGCTERRRASDPVVPNGDTVQVVIPDRSHRNADSERAMIITEMAETEPEPGGAQM